MAAADYVTLWLNGVGVENVVIGILVPVLICAGCLRSFILIVGPRNSRSAP